MVPKAFPEQFRRDVVAVARRREIPMSKIAKDFGISESCLHRWVKQADIEDGVQDGVTAAERAELRESASGTRLSNRRTTSCDEPLPISPRAAPQDEIPAGP